MRKQKRATQKKAVRKRYTRRNGFAFVPLLLIIVGLVLAAGGYYLLVMKKSSGEHMQTANQVQTQAKASKAEIAGVPHPVNQFLDESDIAKIRSHGVTIYTGTTPPDITGNYLLNSLSVLYDPGTWSGAYPVGYHIPSYVYGFSNQKADGSISAHYYSDEIDDTANGLGAFISGENNCFTVFINQVGDTNDCHYSSPQIISACMAPTGIKNFTNSYLPKEKDGSGCDELAPIGYLRIAEESDGLAEKQ
jgi:hypothetical protein